MSLALRFNFFFQNEAGCCQHNSPPFLSRLPDLIGTTAELAGEYFQLTSSAHMDFQLIMLKYNEKDKFFTGEQLVPGFTLVSVFAFISNNHGNYRQ